MDKTTKSIEDYLEAIYLIQQKKGTVRVRDVAECLSVKLPSVTGALKKLTQKGFVKHTLYGEIQLTESGKEIGMKTWEKHQLLYALLHEVFGISESTAYKEACLIEHIISQETENKIKQFIEKHQK